ncbi:hypothetical protein F4803DRAFT_551036 [Xylaria telfairii]|nr:hypothetical protein F4803DRAFT_551036 [Xylaria telfairii]
MTFMRDMSIPSRNHGPDEYMGINHDPEEYKDPDTFDPNRFPFEKGMKALAKHAQQSLWTFGAVIWCFDIQPKDSLSEPLDTTLNGFRDGISMGPKASNRLDFRVRGAHREQVIQIMCHTDQARCLRLPAFRPDIQPSGKTRSLKEPPPLVGNYHRTRKSHRSLVLRTGTKTAKKKG